MTVVADSTPCIYLARLGDLGILHKLFGRIVLPEAVWRELTVEGHLPGASEFQAALDRWVTVQATRQADLDGIMQAEKLERGEVEAIQLARELRAEALLLDEQRAVEYARSLELTVVRTPSIYVAARNAGWIDSVRERLDRLRAAGFWLRDRDYAAVLGACGETPDV
jgi:predicted nucleic acid-binding protein